MDRKEFVDAVYKEISSKQATQLATKYRPKQEIFSDSDVQVILSLLAEKNSPYPKGEPINRASFGLSRRSNTGRFAGTGVVSDHYDDVDNHEAKQRSTRRNTVG